LIAALIPSDKPDSSGSIYGEGDTMLVQNEVVAFRDEMLMDIHAAPTLDNPLAHFPKENYSHSLLNFLERPMLAASFSWTDTLPFNTNLITIDPYVVLLNNTNTYTKITGFRYFRADVEFTLQVNAEPFQQGGLLLWYLPALSTGSDQYSQKSVMAGKTGTLSKVFNLSDAHTIKFKIPFTNPINFCDMINPFINAMGTFYIDVYAPLAVGTVQMSLFVRFLNPELEAPTSFVNLPPGVKAQVGDESVKMEKSGTVVGKTVASKVVSAIGSVASSVGSFFPAAKIVTTPLSWASSMVGGLLSSFGWSKPVSVQTTDIVRQKTNRYFQNFNGIDTSENLGLDCDNAVDQFPLFATDLDEMAFDNIVTVFNYGDQFNWATTDAVGATLFSVTITPTMFDKIATQGTSPLQYRTLNSTYLSFVSHFFKYWCGDITLQFRAFKTNYHSGRLRISWNPGVSLGTAANMPEGMVYSVIWDLRTQHTTAVTVPYMSNMPWLEVTSFTEAIKGAQVPTANGFFNSNCSKSIGSSFKCVTEFSNQCGSCR